MTLKEKLEQEKFENWSEEQQKLSKNVEENGPYYNFKECVSESISEVLFERLDYDKVEDFEVSQVILQGETVDKISFKISGRYLKELFGYDIGSMAEITRYMTGSSSWNERFQFGPYENHLLSNGVADFKIIRSEDMPGKFYFFDGIGPDICIKRNIDYKVLFIDARKLQSAMTCTPQSEIISRDAYVYRKFIKEIVEKVIPKVTFEDNANSLLKKFVSNS